jgi:hypothetical protein
MANPPNLRLAATLAFIASALALAAALITYLNGEGIKWSLLAGAAFMAALGWSNLRRSKPTGS